MDKIDAIASPTHSFPMADHVFKRDGRICQYCGTSTASVYVMEHVIPWSIGGHTATYNLVVACQSCNSSKRSNVWLPINIHKLEEENLEWANQIYALTEPSIPNPPLVVSIHPERAWWLLMTAFAQGLTPEDALSDAIYDWTTRHRMIVANPPDEPPIMIEGVLEEAA